MERGYVAAPDYLLYDLVIDKLAAEEFFSAVYHTGADGFNVFKGLEHPVLLIQQCLQDDLYTDRMVRDRHFLDVFFLSCGLMLYAARLHTDPLDKSFCKKIIDIIVLHIEKLVLQRRASTVQNQNDHIMKVLKFFR